MYLRDFFALKPFHKYSLCILHSVCILPLVRSLRFTLTEVNILYLAFVCLMESYKYVNGVNIFYLLISVSPLWIYKQKALKIYAPLLILPKRK